MSKIKGLKEMEQSVKTAHSVANSHEKRDRILASMKKFYKSKGLPMPKVTSGQRDKTMKSEKKRKTYNHFLAGAVDIAADEHADELIKHMKKEGHRTVDEREMVSLLKSKRKASIGRGVLHFDASNIKPDSHMKDTAKAYDYANPRKLTDYVFKKEDRKDKEDREFERGKYKKVVAKKKMQKNISGYSITSKQLESIKKQFKGRPFHEYADELSKYRVLE